MAEATESGNESATGHTHESEKIAEVLKGCFADLAERDNKRLEGIEEAIAALKPAPSQTDHKTAFWNVYKTVSEEHDDEFRDKYNGDLDASLIFAGLFSAVNSAFIIQIQPGLQPDPVATNEALLRILIHTVNSSAFNEDDLNLPVWNGPPHAIVVIEGLLYVSLFTALFAAFLAVLGKQWVAYYSSAGMKGTISQRGIKRQKKFDGFKKWGFEHLMKAVPMLLQIALLLFAAALSRYLQTIHTTIASLVVSFTSFGVALYIFFIISAVCSESCPFRTPLSNFILHVYPSSRKVGGWLKGQAIRAWKSTIAYHVRISNRLRAPSGEISCNLEPKTFDFQMPWEYRPGPIFKRNPIAEADDLDALVGAVIWTLETSTDPKFVAAAASVVPEIDFLPDRNVTAALVRLRDTFIACFRISTLPKLRPSTERFAIACGKAYYHWFFHSPNTIHHFPPSFFLHLSNDWLDSCGWSTELQLVYNLLDSLTSAYDPRMRYTRRLGYVALMDVEPRRKWTYKAISNSKVDILSHYVYYSDDGKEGHMKEMARVVFGLRHTDPTAFTDWLLCLGICCGVSVNPHDLAPFDRSGYCRDVLQVVLEHFSKFLGNIQPGAQGADNVLEKLHWSLQMIIALLVKLDSPPIPGRLQFLWKVVYMFMAVSRSTGVGEVCPTLAAYFERKAKGIEPFVDLQWTKMLDDFKRCNLDVVLAQIPSKMYLRGKIFEWDEGELGFKLLNLPSCRPQGGVSHLVLATETRTVSEDHTALSSVVVGYPATVSEVSTI